MNPIQTHCKRHGIEKTVSFNGKGRRVSSCAECCRGYRKKRYTSAAVWQRQHRLQQYGLSEQKWLLLFVRQRGRCAVCSEPFASDNRRIHVDHCHRSGKVRGLLCVGCNTVTIAGIDRAINAGFLERAINYVVENTTGSALGADGTRRRVHNPMLSAA